MNPKVGLPKLYLEPLIPWEAYVGVCINCTKMLYECQGSELLFYMDVTSMSTFVMCAFKFPLGKPDMQTRTVVFPMHTASYFRSFFFVFKNALSSHQNIFLMVLFQNTILSLLQFLFFLLKWLAPRLPLNFKWQFMLAMLSRRITSNITFLNVPKTFSKGTSIRSLISRRKHLKREMHMKIVKGHTQFFKYLLCKLWWRI